MESEEYMNRKSSKQRGEAEVRWNSILINDMSQRCGKVVLSL